MKKILLSTVIALLLLISSTSLVAATDTGLGISPVSLDITLAEGESGVWDFCTYYFSGTINIEAIDVPISVSPSSIEVLSSPSLLSLTLTNIATTAGVYTGYLRFTGLSAENTGLAIQIDVNVSVTATVGAPASSGGGGGNGGGASTGYTVESSDGLVSLNIPEGTVVRNTSGNVFPAYYVQTTALAESPPPPAGSNIIGLAYDFQPAGATFSPPITLTFALPEEVADSDLTLAFYDAAIGEWVLLDSVVNPEAGTITASVSHFTAFAVLVTLPRTVEPTPVPAPTPIVPEPVILGPAPATPEPAPPAPEPVASELTLEPVTPEPVGLPVEPEVAGWVWALMSIGVLVLASSLVWWRLRRRKP